MSYKKLFIFLFALFLISGCSKDTNKAKLDETMFEDGKQVVKLYSQTYNGKNKESEAVDSADSFLSKYESDSYSNKNEENFVTSVKLLQLKYQTYGIQKVNESMGVDDNSDGTKEEIKDLLLQIKEEFGISLE